MAPPKPFSSGQAILLLTGAWHVPEHYEKLTSALADRVGGSGARVLCPQLPSNSGAYPPKGTLAGDVAFVRELVAAEAARGTRLTVLAHSWGGMVASTALGEFALPSSPTPAAATPGANERSEDKKNKGGVERLVFVCAFVPAEGESLFSMLGGAPPPCQRAHDDDGTLRWDDPRARLFGDEDISPAEARRAVDLMVWHPWRAQREVGIAKEEGHASGGKGEKRPAWRVLPLTYVVCEADRALPVEAQDMMLARVRREGGRLREVRLPCGHSPFINRVDDIVDIVTEAMQS